MKRGRQEGATSFIAIPLDVLNAEIAELPKGVFGADEDGNPIEKPVVMVGKTWWKSVQVAKIDRGNTFTIQTLPVAKGIKHPQPHEGEDGDIDDELEEAPHAVDFTISEPAAE
jgi:hypothetical protein